MSLALYISRVRSSDLLDRTTRRRLISVIFKNLCCAIHLISNSASMQYAPDRNGEDREAKSNREDDLKPRHLIEQLDRTDGRVIWVEGPKPQI